MRLGLLDVDRDLLKRIPAWKLHEWKAYEELEPFPDERADLSAAHIVQYLWAATGDPKKYPNGRPLSDFLLKFGDSNRVTAPPVQTVEYQELLIDGWIAGHNAALAGKTKGVN